MIKFSGKFFFFSVKNLFKFFDQKISISLSIRKKFRVFSLSISLSTFEVNFRFRFRVSTFGFISLSSSSNIYIFNRFIDKEKKQLKIGDFGLARNAQSRNYSSYQTSISRSPLAWPWIAKEIVCSEKDQISVIYYYLFKIQILFIVHKRVRCLVLWHFALGNLQSWRNTVSCQ